MTEALRIWRQRADPFSAVVSASADWHAPTPCTEWSARDLVAHVVTTEREFLAEHGLLPDGGNDPGIGHPAGESADPVKLWHEHDRLVSDLLADPAVAERDFPGYFGPSTIGETLTGFYGVDLLIHRWDLAASQGLDARLGAEDLSAIDTAVDGFGEQAYSPGVYARPVPVPDDAGRLARVLARTGRRA